MRRTPEAMAGQELLIKELKTAKEVFRDLRNYLAGQFVGATRDDTLLEEVLKCLFCKLYAETGAVEPVPNDADVFLLAKDVRATFAKVRANFPDIYSDDCEILLDPEGIARVVRACYFSLVDATSDPIGDAFEVFVRAAIGE